MARIPITTFESVPNEDTGAQIFGNTRLGRLRQATLELHGTSSRGPAGFTLSSVAHELGVRARRVDVRHAPKLRAVHDTRSTGVMTNLT